MKKLDLLDSKLLLRNFVRYISVAILVLTALIITALSLAHQKVEKEEERMYYENINKSTKHVINHYLKDYTHKLRRLLETTSLAQLLEEGDRDGLYALLKPKFDLFKDEALNFQVMHIHLADGTSFLRMHQPMFYGDDIATIRPMLQKIHKEHTIISGYETGVYANVYRIMGPIFNKDGEYIGALEIGLNPNFIVDKMQEINGYRGVYFVREYMPHIYKDANDFVLDGYRLHAQSKKRVAQIKEMMQGQQYLKEHLHIQYKGKTYLTHVLSLTDFAGEDIIKLLFFQELKKNNLFFTPLQIGIYIAIGVMLLFFIRLIYIRIQKYQDAVTKVYKEKIDLIQKHEETLESLQSYHRTLFEATPNILIRTNGTSIEDANSLALHFFGYETLYRLRNEVSCICDFFIEDEGCLTSEVSGVHWLEYIKQHPEKIHKVCILNNGQKHHFVLYVKELEKEETGSSLVSFVDVTRFDTLAERLEMAVSGTDDGLWDWNVATGEVYFSPRWKSMLGYEDAELENSLEIWTNRVHPDDLAAALEAIEKSQKDKQSYNAIHRLQHKDGHWVWILDRGKNYYDADGNISRMVGFHTDISELKELESELKDSKNLFEMFMNHIPYLVAIREDTGKLVYANRPFNEFREEIMIQCKDQIDVLLQEAREGGIAENVLEYQDGEREHIYRVLFFRIIQASGEMLIAEIFINMTKQKLLTKELEMKNDLMIAQSRHAEMGEMISIIAHQWRQPLGVITMNVNNVLVDIELESLEENSLKEALEAINMQTLHLSQTIDDFRNFFKPDKVRQSVVIADVFEQAYSVMKQSLKNHDIVLRRDFEQTSKVKLFTRELQQVFINILKNAKEAIEESENSSKEIGVRIYEEPNSVVVSICDKAGGIKESIAQKIFEPYFSTKEEKNGTGLGLYMSKMIVEKHHGGELLLETTSEGSCFLIYIPVIGGEHE